MIALFNTNQRIDYQITQPSIPLTKINIHFTKNKNHHGFESQYLTHEQN